MIASELAVVPPWRKEDLVGVRHDEEGSAIGLDLLDGDVVAHLHDTHAGAASITQIGPWGGPGGTLREIEVVPICLNSITIRSDESIQSIAFSYSDKSGKQHDIGAWGVQGGLPVVARYDTIQLAPSEFLIQVSGTIGPCNIHSSTVVTSLMFRTNASCYGPFGAEKGTPFHSPLMNNGCIVGFFARAMGSVDAIGVYVNPRRELMEKQALVTKVGLWGSSKGCPYDVDVLPRRLISVVVCYGKAVYSLAFTYYDFNGKQQSSGSWGGSDEYQDGILYTILLGDSEFLKEISGTIGQCSGFPDLLTSVQFITNNRKYGPFGEGGGNAFCSPTQNDGSIVGFFANAGKYVYSIGLYVDTMREEYNNGSACANLNLEGDIKELDKACTTKIGPWGGCKGDSNDMKVSPRRLNSITIRSGDVIHSLAFSYSDKYGKQHHAGPWGSCKGFSYGIFHTVQLAPSEFLTEVSGTIGFAAQYSSNVITSITFDTNAGQYGPFGGGGGIPFHSPVMSNGNIVGFFAHAERVVESIGLYVSSERKPMKEQDSVTKIGPWGGDSGRPSDVDVLPRRLISVVVHHSTIINSLAFTYIDLDGQEQTVGPWGGMGEPLDVEVDMIVLDRSEFLMEVSGTIGRNSENSDVVKSLHFVTNTRRYKLLGKGGGTTFQSPLESNGSIVGFFVNAGDVIDAIGVYFSPKRETIKEEEEGGSGISRGMSFTKGMDMEPASKDLERIMRDGSAKPMNLPLALLQYITEDFSAKRIIGHGGFGIVYRGDLQNGSVAVKKLLNSHTIEEKSFKDEATSLIDVQHPNIVRFLGYCSNTENKLVELGATLKYVLAEIRERLLCFEYINNGSLDKYLTDELRGLEWHTRYQIIRGICNGLVYLHKEKGMVHRDMKPANILLDDLMIPKITDFGISKFLDGATHVVTSSSARSMGYCAPEFIDSSMVSFKFDIYSLGVIIRDLVTGSKDDPDINHVLRRWRYRWNKSANYPPSGYQQVRKCIEIARECVSFCPKSRPDILNIVCMLDDMEMEDADDSPVAPISPYAWELFEFDTLELNFPFEINNSIPCSLQLTNVTEDHIAFDIEMIGELKYCIEPERGVVPPRSKSNVMITVQARKSKPMVCKDEFLIRCATVNEDRMPKDITKNMFDKNSGKVVDEVTLKVVI